MTELRAHDRQPPPAVAVTLPASAGRPAKRSFTIGGHRTSISIETPFWEAFVAIAAEYGCSVAGLVAAIDRARGNAGLSSAIRVYVLEHHRRHAPAGATGNRMP